MALPETLFPTPPEYVRVFYQLSDGRVVLIKSIPKSPSAQTLTKEEVLAKEGYDILTHNYIEYLYGDIPSDDTTQLEVETIVLPDGTITYLVKLVEVPPAPEGSGATPPIEMIFIVERAAGPEGEAVSSEIDFGDDLFPNAVVTSTTAGDLVLGGPFTGAIPSDNEQLDTTEDGKIVYGVPGALSILGTAAADSQGLSEFPNARIFREIISTETVKETDTLPDTRKLYFINDPTDQLIDYLNSFAILRPYTTEEGAAEKDEKLNPPGGTPRTVKEVYFFFVSTQELFTWTRIKNEKEKQASLSFNQMNTDIGSFFAHETTEILFFYRDDISLPDDPGVDRMNELADSGVSGLAAVDATREATNIFNVEPEEEEIPEATVGEEGFTDEGDVEAGGNGGGTGGGSLTEDEKDHILEAATYVRNNYPQFFQSDDRALAYDMMTVVIERVRSMGVSAERNVVHSNKPRGDPYRYGSDSLVVHGTSVDIYRGWPNPATPQVLVSGTGVGEWP